MFKKLALSILKTVGGHEKKGIKGLRQQQANQKQGRPAPAQAAGSE
jgi:hypothetical protein